MTAVNQLGESMAKKEAEEDNVFGRINGSVFVFGGEWMRETQFSENVFCFFFYQLIN